MTDTGITTFSPLVTTIWLMAATTLYCLANSRREKLISFSDLVSGQHHTVGMSCVPANDVMEGSGRRFVQVTMVTWEVDTWELSGKSDTL